MRIQRYLQRFWSTEKAQDLVEYALLLAICVLTAVVFMIMLAPSIRSIWGTSNAVLSNGATIASS